MHYKNGKKALKEKNWPLINSKVLQLMLPQIRALSELGTTVHTTMISVNVDGVFGHTGWTCVGKSPVLGIFICRNRKALQRWIN